MSILVVDDIQDNISILKAILTREGYGKILEANSAARAFELLAESNKNDDSDVDLILMDIMMPEVDGIKACRQIKSDSLFQETPIIMVTAKTETESLKEAFDAGAMDYITKPFKPIELIARVRSAVRLKEQINARKQRETELNHKNQALEKALQEIKVLRDFIPICSVCKNIRDMEGQWQRIEAYFQQHSDVVFSHGICDDCMKTQYPDIDINKNRGIE